MYEELIVAVRSVNLGLPPERRLRIVAANYPIDFSNPPAPGDRMDRDAAAAAIIRREILDKKRKALVVFGFFHLFRHRPEFMRPTFFPTGTLVSLLESDPRAKWFLIAPLSGSNLPPAIAATRAGPDRPALVMARGAVGAVDAMALAWAEKPNIFTVGRFMDAFLYFGRVPDIGNRAR